MSLFSDNIPGILQLSSIGSPMEGYITVAEVQKDIAFEIRRVYWTYFTPQNVIRGFHAHKALQQVIFAVSGKIFFKTEDGHGVVREFTLDDPKMGLYIPPFVWREITFWHNAVLLCLASIEYTESDYIRNYEDFKEVIRYEK